MQDSKIEEEIVKYFFIKCKQKRLLWELNNPKKREKIIHRIIAIETYKSECLKPVKYLSEDDMERLLLDLAKKKDIYFIGESYIGALPIKEAVNRVGRGEWCLIYCGNGTGYLQAEQQEHGPSPQYLLSQKNKQLFIE